MREFFGYPAALDVFKAQEDLDKAKISSRDYKPHDYLRYADEFAMRVLGKDHEVVRTPMPTWWLNSIDSSWRRRTKAGITTPIVDVHYDPERGDPKQGMLSQRAWQIAFSNNSENNAVKKGHWIREHLIGGHPGHPHRCRRSAPDMPDQYLARAHEGDPEATAGSVISRWIRWAVAGDVRPLRALPRTGTR